MDVERTVQVNAHWVSPFASIMRALGCLHHTQSKYVYVLLQLFVGGNGELWIWFDLLINTHVCSASSRVFPMQSCWNKQRQLWAQGTCFGTHVLNDYGWIPCGFCLMNNNNWMNDATVGCWIYWFIALMSVRCGGKCALQPDGWMRMQFDWLTMQFNNNWCVSSLDFKWDANGRTAAAELSLHKLFLHAYMENGKIFLKVRSHIDDGVWRVGSGEIAEADHGYSYDSCEFMRFHSFHFFRRKTFFIWTQLAFIWRYCAHNAHTSMGHKRNPLYMNAILSN